MFARNTLKARRASRFSSLARTNYESIKDLPARSWSERFVDRIDPRRKLASLAGASVQRLVTREESARQFLQD
jgi:hypothetical protein